MDEQLTLFHEALVGGISLKAVELLQIRESCFHIYTTVHFLPNTINNVLGTKLGIRPQ